ncbi:MAG: DUF2997 domain-containing protein [Pirellulaceae bacterium]
MQKQIVVNISVEGDAVVEAQGIVGSGCKDLTRDIERALGVVKSDERKPEFYRSAPQQQQARQ